LGTVATGVWNGTAIGIAYGGTGQATATAGFNALSPITTTGDLIIGNGTNSATRLPIGLNTYVLTSNGTTATWAASGSGGSGTVNSGTQYQLGYYASTGTAISGNANIKTDANSNLNLAATSATLNSANTFGFKNRFINGGMVIDQRNAGAAWGTSINDYGIDRWGVYQSPTGKLNGGQNYNSISLPNGFTNYAGIQSQSAYSVSGSNYYLFQQLIEGFNIADLGWGTANAKTVTLSFLVQSSLTGTFGGAIQNNSANRSYPFTYSIPVANVWTTISITIVGDTSGTWLTTNATGIIVRFGLGIGSTFSGTAGSWASGTYFSATGATSVVGTLNATWYITGVQFEVGTQATSFDFRDYGRELILCQRYFAKSYSISVKPATNVGAAGGGVTIGGGTIDTYKGAYAKYPINMRTSPSLIYYDNVGNSGAVSYFSVGAWNNSGSYIQNLANDNSLGIQLNNITGATAISFDFTLNAEL
jgi:hypothetical protein